MQCELLQVIRSGAWGDDSADGRGGGDGDEAADFEVVVAPSSRPAAAESAAARAELASVAVFEADEEREGDRGQV